MTVALWLLLLALIAVLARVRAYVLSPGRFTMLPPFIIEQIRRREEQERARHEQPRLEIPADRPAPRAPHAPEEKVDRGVIIIEL